MRSIGPSRLGVVGRDARAGGPDIAANARDLKAGHEAFQIALLLVAEVGRSWCFKLHDDDEPLFRSHLHDDCRRRGSLLRWLERGVERYFFEHKTAYEIAERHGDLVPHPPVIDADLG